MPLKPPALDPITIPPRLNSAYPEPFRARVLPREKRALGDALGLTKIGVNLTTLSPGKESSMRHFHTHEDELVFVLEGELVLRTDAGEQVLTAGMCAGSPRIVSPSVSDPQPHARVANLKIHGGYGMRCDRHRHKANLRRLALHRLCLPLTMSLYSRCWNMAKPTPVPAANSRRERPLLPPPQHRRAGLPQLIS